MIERPFSLSSTTRWLPRSNWRGRGMINDERPFFKSSITRRRDVSSSKNAILHTHSHILFAFVCMSRPTLVGNWNWDLSRFIFFRHTKPQRDDLFSSRDPSLTVGRWFRNCFLCICCKLGENCHKTKLQRSCIIDTTGCFVNNLCKLTI